MACISNKVYWYCLRWQHKRLYTANHTLPLQSLVCCCPQSPPQIVLKLCSCLNATEWWRNWVLEILQIHSTITAGRIHTQHSTPWKLSLVVVPVVHTVALWYFTMPDIVRGKKPNSHKEKVLREYQPDTEKPFKPLTLGKTLKQLFSLLWPLF